MSNFTEFHYWLTFYNLQNGTNGLNGTLGGTEQLLRNWKLKTRYVDFFVRRTEMKIFLYSQSS